MKYAAYKYSNTDCVLKLKIFVKIKNACQFHIGRYTRRTYNNSQKRIHLFNGTRETEVKISDLYVGHFHLPTKVKN